MKRYWIMTAVLSIIMVFFPLISLSVSSKKTQETASVTLRTQTTAVKEDEEKEDNSISVLRVSSSKVINLEMFEYLVGCVAAEMPASFHSEALKAQAVASYSYAMWIKSSSDAQYDISDNPSVHQGYLDSDELKERWGEDYEKNLKKIEDAVSSVIGQYLTYENETAMCIYHAISAGSTQSAENAWGKDIPYLKSVVAVGDALSPDIDSSVELTFSETEKCLDVSKIKSKKIKVTADENGYVTDLSVGDKHFSGIEAASLLGLKSPCFTVEKGEKGYTFTVRGKGHGIGMSQYSAQYMARQGSTYEEILAKFYPGTQLVTVQ